MEAETKHVDRLDWRTMISAAEDTPANIITALDTYFEPFAQPSYRDGDKSNGMDCIECGKPLTGLTAVFFGGGFTWGLVHGEGFCAACKWPGRAMHYVKDSDGKELLAVRNVVLQYHPDVVTQAA